MSAPTQRQLEVVEVVRSFTAEHGYAPTVREVSELCGVNVSTTHHHLLGAERNGLLRRDLRRPRALVVVDPDGSPVDQLGVAEAALVELYGLIVHQLDPDPCGRWSGYHGDAAAQALADRLQDQHEGPRP